MTDAKVWNAPSIGRVDGMSVESKCYQNVVLWADYQALQARVAEHEKAVRLAFMEGWAMGCSAGESYCAGARGSTPAKDWQDSEAREATSASAGTSREA